MLRSEIIRAVGNLRAAIIRTSVADLLMGGAGPHSGPDAAPKNLIDLYRSWVIATNEFGEAEKQILKIYFI
jgi:hypothetical protein